MPRPPKKPLPNVSVLDRRLQNPFGAPSVAITLKEGRWALRWFSESVRTGRIYQGQQLGWTFVVPEDLRSAPEDIGGQALDGRIVRGEAAHREVLMKMPQADFDQIQAAKAAKNLSEIGSESKTKTRMADAAGARFGDQAAETVYQSNISITDERRAFDLEGDAPPTEPA